MMCAAAITTKGFKHYRQHTSPMSIHPKWKHGMLATAPTMTCFFHFLRSQLCTLQSHEYQSARAHLLTPTEYRPVADSPSSRRHALHPRTGTGTPLAYTYDPKDIGTALTELKTIQSTAITKKMLNYISDSSRVGGRLDSGRHISQISHIASSTSRTTLLSLIHSWSSALRVASEECQLLLARTSLVLQTKTS